MKNPKIGFEEFLAFVDKANAEFVAELHQELLKAGCFVQVKEAKSGYVVSYLLHQKTIANYVFRKKGLIIRIYANHIHQYAEFLDTLPDGMANSIMDAPDCKRLLHPDACNSKCAMGYDFLMGGERYRKCRSNAFLFLLSEDNNPYIRRFLQQELEACA